MLNSPLGDCFETEEAKLAFMETPLEVIAGEIKLAQEPLGAFLGSQQAYASIINYLRDVYKERIADARNLLTNPDEAHKHLRGAISLIKMIEYGGASDEEVDLMTKEVTGIYNELKQEFKD